MKTKLLLLIIISVQTTSIYAQMALKGNVYDNVTRQPIPGVSVYLDGTTFGTSSDVDGKFALEVSRTINTKLIMSHISYETLVVTDPFGTNLESVYLKPKDIEVESIVVHADPFTREEKLKAFREQFLGRTIAGKNCKILNEDDISLYYNPAQRRLTASAVKEIVVQNSYLGYELHYALDDFYTRFDRITLNGKDQIETLFIGTTRFVDKQPGSQRYYKRRQNVYDVSSKAFMRRLSTGYLPKSTFSVYNGEVSKDASLLDVYKHFSVDTTDSKKAIEIVPGTGLKRTHSSLKPEQMAGDIFGVLYVRNENSAPSEIVFYTPRFHVDEFGNIDEIDRILFRGYMAAQRVGDMLPLEFEPEDALADKRGIYIF